MRPILFALALAASFLSSPAGLSWLAPSGGSFNKGGCGADPSGLCAPSAQAVPLDEGCGADPSGRCAASAHPSGEGGCGMDPNGCP